MSEHRTSFPWGRITVTHDVAEHQITEYVEKGSDRTLFHVPTSPLSHSGRSYGSLDEAIVGAIAIKYDGPNTQAGKFFCLMVGIEVAT